MCGLLACLLGGQDAHIGKGVTDALVLTSWNGQQCLAPRSFLVGAYLSLCLLCIGRSHRCALVHY